MYRLQQKDKIAVEIEPDQEWQTQKVKSENMLQVKHPMKLITHKHNNMVNDSGREEIRAAFGF